MSTKMSKTTSNKRSSTILLFLAMCVCVFAHAADGAPSTVITKLAISPSSVEIGSPVSLTATVLNSGTPVRHGLVMFCDAKAVRCQGLAVLGAAQLARNGTATMKLTLGGGRHTVSAVFQGTPHSVPALSRSVSAPQQFSVKHQNQTSKKETNLNVAR
jgi:hypothetical protein